MLADIAGFYKAFGLQVSSTHPDRPDHVVLQCEFLAQLIHLQWQAGQSFDPLDALHVRVCDEAAHRFLKEHVIWWFPAFAKLLVLQNPGGFYEAVAHFLAALVTAERALARLDPPRHAVEPSPIENSDACSGCELAIH
jgi:TorA maturation chaperone TorD